MTDRIIPFPSRTGLSTWLEKHVARPSSARLLMLHGYNTPYPDLNPGGVLVSAGLRPSQVGRFAGAPSWGTAGHSVSAKDV